MKRAVIALASLLLPAVSLATTWKELDGWTYAPKYKDTSPLGRTNWKVTDSRGNVATIGYDENGFPYAKDVQRA